MENLISKLEEIVNDFEKNKSNISQEEFNNLKNREFELFEKIETIRELSEYFKTDMTIDSLPQHFISGMYSGVVNGAMFVIDRIQRILRADCSDKDRVVAITKELSKIQGLDSEESDNTEETNG